MRWNLVSSGASRRTLGGARSFRNGLGLAVCAVIAGCVAEGVPPEKGATSPDLPVRCPREHTFPTFAELQLMEVSPSQVLDWNAIPPNIMREAYLLLQPKERISSSSGPTPRLPSPAYLVRLTTHAGDRLIYWVDARASVLQKCPSDPALNEVLPSYFLRGAEPDEVRQLLLQKK